MQRIVKSSEKYNYKFYTLSSQQLREISQFKVSIIPEINQFKIYH